MGNWSCSSAFVLSAQTSSAFVFRLWSHAMLNNEFLENDYEFIQTSKFLSDPIERKFSQYRQMSGGRSVVCLREVINSERALSYRALIKADINFRKKGLTADKGKVEGEKRNTFDALSKRLDEKSNEVMKHSLNNAGAEVAPMIM